MPKIFAQQRRADTLLLHLQTTQMYSLLVGLAAQSVEP